MHREFHQQVQTELDAMADKGTLKSFQHLQAPMDAHTRMEGKGDILIMSSNNYLGLASEPSVIEAGKRALDEYGAGTASVRFICGTFEIHRDLEQRLAAFFGTERALSYVACWNANTGLIPTILGPDDVVISDELNHASLIDGIRLASKTPRAIYRHADMEHLAEILKEHSGARRKLVVTDGVFSMEGDLAPLDRLVEVCREHGAISLVDDSHGTGVVGKTGRGVAEHFGVQDQVDIYTSTLGKALGGAAGGFVASSAPVIGLLEQASRPQIFSNALPPTVSASALEALRVLDENPGRVAELQRKVGFCRQLLAERGYEVNDHPSAIIPIMIGETAKAIEASSALLDKGVFVTGFGYPVVPEGTARIRVQVSYAHSEDDFVRFADALDSVMKG
ncbi:MAG: glycine C-acetyltransferase [Armatimonadia bacterium]|nr:glycine C-acetyltransferase [Armatimonadia bacterium]